jgi:hypothetical protein
MYSTLQDPLESAAHPPSRESEEANQRLAERLNVQHIPGKLYRNMAWNFGSTSL